MTRKFGRCLCAAVGVLIGLNVSLIPVDAEALADAGAGAEFHSQVIELETPAGEEAFPYAINNSDVVAGMVTGNVGRAATWDRNGRIRLLDEVLGGSSSVALLINDRGVSAGFVGVFAARWDSEGRVTVLENPGAKWHQILGINNRDEVVGYVGMPDDTNQAVRWDSSGRVAHLEMLPGTIAGMAHDINDDGIAVGNVITNQGGHAVRWDRTGAITELPSVGSGNNEAWAINRHGVITGTIQKTFQTHQYFPAAGTDEAV